MATREKPYLHIGFLLVSQKRKLLEEAMYRLDLMSHSSVIQCYHQFDQVFFFFLSYNYIGIFNMNHYFF